MSGVASSRHQPIAPTGGVAQFSQLSAALVGVVTVSLALLSTAPHQEARFLVPLTLPLALLAGNVLFAPPTASSRRGVSSAASSSSSSSSSSFSSAASSFSSASFSSAWLLRAAWLASSLPLAALFGVAHQGGVLPSLMHFEHVWRTAAASAAASASASYAARHRTEVQTQLLARSVSLLDMQREAEEDGDDPLSFELELPIDAISSARDDVPLAVPFADAMPANLQPHEEELAFFSALHAQFVEVNEFYALKERYFQEQINKIIAHINAQRQEESAQARTFGASLRHRFMIDFSADASMLRSAFKELYRGLDLLRNFRILNYAAFVKIVRRSQFFFFFVWFHLPLCDSRNH
jgi:hypothetical protein